MNFIVCGPFQAERKSNGHIDSSRDAKRKYWEAAQTEQKGIASASGCYLFALSTGGGIMPWYVGKAARQTFEHEIFTPHKLNYFNDVLAACKGSPQFFLIPRVTPKGKLCAPTKAKNGSIDFLETMLIGIALRRNHRTKNISGTALLKTLNVRGVLNSKLRGHPGRGAIEFKKALAL